MGFAVRLLITLAFLALSAQLASADEALVGFWEGAAKSGDARYEISIAIEKRGDSLVGKVDWPAMGYVGADLLSIKSESGRVRFGVPLPLGALYLKGPVNGDAISGVIERIDLVNGEWTNLGPSGSFELHRTAEPEKPYAVREVSIRSGDIALAGSIFLPRTKSKVPAVVFVAGSGDTTRGDGSFLADRLARAGIATLVYDKRGAGLSGGDWKAGGFEELAADASAALAVLRKEPLVDKKRLGFVCQSQGCWVAPIALRSGARARFLVAQSGPAVSVADEDLDFYRVALRRAGFGPADIEEAFDLVRTDQAVSLGAATMADLEAKIARYSGRPWFSTLGYETRPVDDPVRRFDKRTLHYNPKQNLDALRIPSVWIYGAADEVIPVADSIAVVQTSRARPKPEIVVLPEAGHSFTRETPSFPVVVEAYPGVVIDWISRRSR